MLMVFIPLGDPVMKKSSWPVYMKASPEPTKKNCGIKRKTLIGKLEVVRPTAFATDNRFLSHRAAAAIPKVDKTSPIAILCNFVKPVPKVANLNLRYKIQVATRENYHMYLYIFQPKKIVKSMHAYKHFIDY